MFKLKFKQKIKPNTLLCLTLRRKRPRENSRSFFVIINYYLLTSSLKLLPGLNAGTFDAAISISLPVCGLRPLRAAR